MTWLFDSFNRIAAARTAIGFAQGVALYWLYWTADGKVWPGDRPELLWPLVTVATFTPLLAVVGIGNLRWRPFSIWMVVVTLLCGGLGYHMAAQHRTEGGWDSWMWASLCVPWLLFVTNALVTAGEVDRKPIATFPTYFDIAWKQATQLALALVFVGLFWIVLWLGAALFRAIKIEAVAEIIASNWFWIPATTTATAVALHLTDAQLGLVRAARSLLLNLLAWLMPLLVLIGLAFLAALFFTGLAPLWATRVATASLISAATLLILLINSHFQDGEPQGGRFRILIYPRFVGALMLVPLVALASYGLSLRIEQYGLTPQRVLASAFLIVLACHAVGYAIAGIASGPALRGLRATNIASAFVSVAALLAILTPLADPARISVASQVARLESGRIAPAKFDFAFLQLHSGRYGTEAFERLRTNPQGPNAAAITARIAQLAKNPDGRPKPPEASAASRKANIKMLRPDASALPDDFLDQDWNDAKGQGRLPECLVLANQTCEALIAELTGDDTPEIILFDKYQAKASVFARGPQGAWSVIGLLQNSHCKGVEQAIRLGHFEIVPSQFKDLLVNGVRLPVTPFC